MSVPLQNTESLHLECPGKEPLIDNGWLDIAKKDMDEFFQQSALSEAIVKRYFLPTLNIQF